MKRVEKLISIVVPAYNEGRAIGAFYQSLQTVLAKDNTHNYEVLVVDDGSQDDTAQQVRQFAKKDEQLRLICLSRNFGKEIATTAGIHEAKGDAIITLDADGQHPVELIPEFITTWESGVPVVVGVRSANQKEGFVKRVGSRLFYRLFNKVAGIKLVPGSTDYRLIDRSVQKEFTRMTEHNRITRGLIDWLGYDRKYISFVANPRVHGEASYSFKKLFRLAIDSIISNSTSLLYFASYIGLVLVPLSLILGILMAVDTLTGDPLSLNITGTAYLVVLMLCMVGILLMSQGIIGLYLSHIHIESKQRPLYIIDRSKSIGVEES
jgi:dolichol-phosphate mannosyltransferase